MGVCVNKDTSEGLPLPRITKDEPPPPGTATQRHAVHSINTHAHTYFNTLKCSKLTYKTITDKVKCHMRDL